MPLASARAGPARIGARVGCSRRRAIGVLEKWPSPAHPLGRTGTEPGLQARSETFLFFAGYPACPGRQESLPHYSAAAISESITMSSLLMQSWFMLVLRS